MFCNKIVSEGSFHSRKSRVSMDATSSGTSNTSNSSIHRSLFGRKVDHPSSFDDKPAFSDAFKHLNYESKTVAGLTGGIRAMEWHIISI